MSVHRLREVQPGRPLIELNGVSRKFSMRRDRSRSIQGLFMRMLGRSTSEANVFWPLRSISMDINAGDCIGVIGPNGSGKSTLLKLITGILEPTAGDMSVYGRLSSLLELGAGFQGDLTGRENVYLNGSIYGLKRSHITELMDTIVDYAELGEFIDTPVKHYSSGMYVRLGFAVAIHTSPDILLVDEVLAVGDLSFQRKCLNSIYQFRNSGGTILLVSHDLSTIQSICNRVLWLDEGLVQADGDPTDVIMQYQRHVAMKEQVRRVAEKDDPTAGLNEGRRWGTRELEIREVEILGEDDEPKAVFFSGEPMRIRLHYHCSERIDQPVFGFMIQHQNGINVFALNTKLAGLDIPFVHGEGYIDYLLPEIQLLQDEYSVSVAVVDYPDTVTYDYHDRIYSFQVFPGKNTRALGIVALDGEWRLPEEVEEAEKADAANNAACIEHNYSRN